jgi:hypothetical protein
VFCTQRPWQDPGMMGLDQLAFGQFGYVGVGVDAISPNGIRSHGFSNLKLLLCPSWPI